MNYLKRVQSLFNVFFYNRSLTLVPRAQCAFVQYTTRAAAEHAAEKTFNKLVIHGRRLTIKWGKTQGISKQCVGTCSIFECVLIFEFFPSGRLGSEKVDQPARSLEPVPGLPGALPPPPGITIQHAQLAPPPDDFFNLHRLQTAAPLAPWPWRPPPPPLTLHYPSQDPDRMGSHLNPPHP